MALRVHVAKSGTRVVPCRQVWIDRYKGHTMKSVLGLKHQRVKTASMMRVARRDAHAPRPPPRLVSLLASRPASRPPLLASCPASRPPLPASLLASLPVALFLRPESPRSSSTHSAEPVPPVPGALACPSTGVLALRAKKSVLHGALTPPALRQSRPPCYYLVLYEFRYLVP